MPDINDNDIRRIDGGLLLVFRELCRTRRTTAAAGRLGLSQSAVSHALARLRALIGDPLFLRRPHGLEPTRRALELAPRVDALIDLMGAALRPDFAFDPAASARQFNIALTEYAVGVVTGALVRTLQASAPRSSFMLHYLRGYVALDALRRGYVDLAVGRFDVAPKGARREPLFQDRYCVVARQGHPTIKGTINPATWRETGHVWVAASAMFDEPTGPTVGEDPIPDSRAARTVGMVPRWETALALVADSDAIATGPRRLATQQARGLKLQILEPPGEVASWTVSMAWRDEEDAGLDWLRGELIASLG